MAFKYQIYIIKIKLEKKLKSFTHAENVHHILIHRIIFIYIHEQ